MSEAPCFGAELLSVEGLAEIVHVLCRVSDGSGLLELRIVDRDGPPFFTATSNVLPGQAPDS